MKHPHPPRGGHLLLLGATSLGLAGMVFAQQDIPRGKLTVDNTLVRAGVQSELQWQIRYSDSVTNIVNLPTPNVISPKEDLDMRVRVIGSSAARVKNNHGHGNNISGVDIYNPGQGQGGANAIKNDEDDTAPDYDDERHEHHQVPNEDIHIEVYCSINHASWSRIYSGLQGKVVPTEVVIDASVKQGDTIDFAARCYVDSWLPKYSTSTETPNVVILKNGDSVPDHIAKMPYGQLRDFIKPYLSTDGKTVRISDRELLVLFELDQTDPNAAGYDHQDIGLLITFE